jgi:hypothetical protein
MTENNAHKSAARAHQRHTGVPYTQALREVNTGGSVTSTGTGQSGTDVVSSIDTVTAVPGGGMPPDRPGCVDDAIWAAYDQIVQGEQSWRPLAVPVGQDDMKPGDIVTWGGRPMVAVAPGLVLNPANPTGYATVKSLLERDPEEVEKVVFGGAGTEVEQVTGRPVVVRLGRTNIPVAHESDESAPRVRPRPWSDYSVSVPFMLDLSHRWPHCLILRKRDGYPGNLLAVNICQSLAADYPDGAVELMVCTGQEVLRRHLPANVEYINPSGLDRVLSELIERRQSLLEDADRGGGGEPLLGAVVVVVDLNSVKSNVSSGDFFSQASVLTELLQVGDRLGVHCLIVGDSSGNPPWVVERIHGYVPAIITVAPGDPMPGPVRGQSAR